MKKVKDPAVTIECIASAAMVGRTDEITIADFRNRFHEVDYDAITDRVKACG